MYQIRLNAGAGMRTQLSSIKSDIKKIEMQSVTRRLYFSFIVLFGKTIIFRKIALFFLT